METLFKALTHEERERYFQAQTAFMNHVGRKHDKAVRDFIDLCQELAAKYDLEFDQQP